MADETYFGKALEIADPSNCPVEITPDDDNDLEYGEPNYISVGTEGTIVADFKDAPINPVTVPVLAGFLPMRPTRIYVSSTATGIVAWYGKAES